MSSELGVGSSAFNPKSEFQNPKPVSVNPFKTSPGLGAAYAIQGIKGAIALFHAAPGCTFLGKVLLTQHLKEPVGLVGTDIKEMPVIMGGTDELAKKIKEVGEKFKPSLIGVIGTALSEVRGEDIENTIAECGVWNAELKTKILHIPAPDYMGGFEDGYAKAVEALLEGCVGADLCVCPKKGEHTGSPLQDQINILPSASLTIGDLDEIKDIVSAFGLKPVVLPDVSLSVDGSKERYSILPADGTTIDNIHKMKQSAATIAIGKSMHKAGDIFSKKFNTPVYKLNGLIGLDATDEFIKLLMNISGKDASENIRRWRRRLVDGMVDAHLIAADKKIAIGLDGDIVPGISAICREMGMRVLNFKSQISNLKFNDLEDLENEAEDADLIIANSHGKEISERLGIPLLRMGFPVYDRFGETLKARVGYRGTLNILFEIANIFAEASEHGADGIAHRANSNLKV